MLYFILATNCLTPLFQAGRMTVKYIYGPASVSSSKDGVIGSSLSGRLETDVGLSRMTTIAMPMKGNYLLIHILV
jgi:hypothetical protein